MRKVESEKEEEQRGSQPIERLPYYSSGSLANTTVISLAATEDRQIPGPGSAYHYYPWLFLLLLAHTIAKPAVIEKWPYNNITV